jgi:phosphoribosylanthranilate isomerase
VSIWIKVCGITDAAAASACGEAGVDAVGFVFADSPRRVSLAQAARIAASLPPSMARVAVFRRPRPDEVSRVGASFRPDLVQADRGWPTDRSEWEALPVFHESATVTGEIRSFVDDHPGALFLYEGARSGVGQRVDWERASQIARLGPMILAGGLTPDNVTEAVRTVRPHGVDVSSGVESRRGRKDPGRIRDFVSAARAAEGEEGR